MALGLAVLLSGCPNQQELEPKRTDEDEARLRELMRKQLETIDAIHFAIAFGELGKARASAQWLAENVMVTPVPPSWSKPVSAIQVNAKKLAGAKKLSDVGESLGAVLAACGSCHQKLGLAIKASGEAIAPKAEPINKRMLQHTFAMSQLAYGLLLPSENLWDQGAAIIEAGSFDLEGDPPSAIDAKESDAIAAELKELGTQATTTITLVAKGRLYSQMMARCSGCHERTRTDKGPKK